MKVSGYLMLNDYIGKKVRILVSSDSGTSAISSAKYGYYNGVITSVMNFYGVVRRIDDKFIELVDAKYTLYNLDTEKSIGFVSPNKIEIPIFESDKILVNVNNVITISLI